MDTAKRINTSKRKNTMQIDIKKLVAANEFASTEQTRFYLNGVLFEVKENKGRFVSTDGHRMIIFDFDCEGPDCSVIIPSTLIKKLKLDKHLDLGEIAIDGDNIKIDYYGATYGERAIDGTYPDYRRILPADDLEQKGAALIGFNPAYLGSFEKLNKALGKKNAYIHLTIYGPDHAVKVTSPDCDYTAIIMPTRT